MTDGLLLLLLLFSRLSSHSIRIVTREGVTKPTSMVIVLTMEASVEAWSLVRSEDEDDKLY